MARIRTVKPKFWDDVKLSKVSRDSRLLFIGMWNFADDFGVILADTVWLKSKIFPYDTLTNELDLWVAELIKFKFILKIFYNDEFFYFIQNFNKHQRIDKPNHEEIFIPRNSLSGVLEQSRINPGLFQEQSTNNRLTIQGGGERIGEDRKGGERIKGAPENEKKINNQSSISTAPIYSIEHCMGIALIDTRWINVNKTSENELKIFNKFLEKQGVYEKSPIDYKSHFGNWKRKKPEELDNTQKMEVKIKLR